MSYVNALLDLKTARCWCGPFVSNVFWEALQREYQRVPYERREYTQAFERPQSLSGRDDYERLTRLQCEWELRQMLGWLD
ncbi:MAG: hypothetical protein U0931_39990 [Vulcanimicrobiota bacterium]